MAEGAASALATAAAISAFFMLSPQIRNSVYLASKAFGCFTLNTSNLVPTYL